MVLLSKSDSEKPLELCNSGDKYKYLTIYQIKHGLLSDYLIQQLKNPSIAINPNILQVLFHMVKAPVLGNLALGIPKEALGMGGSLQ